MGISRRDFLMRVGQVGGYSAAFATMQSLGLMPMKGEQVAPIQAAAGSGKGVKVVVLGGGIGGLVSAYELKKLGYDVTLLEARERPGGRNWTGRNGTKVKFVDGTKQVINWEEGNYQNLGPARLPSTHWTMLGYCRELGRRAGGGGQYVALDVFAERYGEWWEAGGAAEGDQRYAGACVGAAVEVHRAWGAGLGGDARKTGNG